MSKHMCEQMRMEPTEENYECYYIQPAHEHEYWKEVIDAITQSPDWYQLTRNNCEERMARRSAHDDGVWVSFDIPPRLKRMKWSSVWNFEKEIGKKFQQTL